MRSHAQLGSGVGQRKVVEKGMAVQKGLRDVQILAVLLVSLLTKLSGTVVTLTQAHHVLLPAKTMDQEGIEGGVEGPKIKKES